MEVKLDRMMKCDIVTYCSGGKIRSLSVVKRFPVLAKIKEQKMMYNFVKIVISYHHLAGQFFF